MAEQLWPRRWLAAGLLFAVAAEWVRPLAAMSEWTEVYDAAPFMLFIAGVLAVDALRVHRAIALAVQGLMAVSVVAALFAQTTIFHKQWWTYYAAVCQADIQHILGGEPWVYSPENRTLLLLVLCMGAVSAIFSIIWYKRTAVWLACCTVICLLTLRIVADVNTTWGVMRAIAACLLLYGLAVRPSLERAFGAVERASDKPLARAAAAAAIIGLAVGSGLLLAVAGGASPDKYPELTRQPAWDKLLPVSRGPGSAPPAAAGGAEEADGRARTGYGSDDSQLGGALDRDGTVAFVAVAERFGEYWRGESKSGYTGSGWVSIDGDETQYAPGEPLPNVLAAGGGGYVGTLDVLVADASARRALPLLSGGAVLRVDRAATASRGDLSAAAVVVPEYEGKYSLALEQQAGSGANAAYYRLQQYIPDKAAQAALLLDREWGQHEQSLADYAGQRYVQLPPELPERVRELAAAITSGLESPFAQAQAIEAYLRSSYVYTLEPPQAGGAEGDFADRFLFEQRAGYCDHFSTAMVVLLRASGIPARWVKGYSAGAASAAPDNEYVLQWAQAFGVEDELAGLTAQVVLSSDAHSWAEAYFPGVGWVAFEPTPGQGTAAGAAAQEELAAVSVWASAHSSAQQSGGDPQAAAFGGQAPGRPLRQWLAATAEQLPRPAALTALAAAVATAAAAALLALRAPRGKGRLALQARLLIYALGFGGRRDADVRLLERLIARAAQRRGAPAAGTLREAVEPLRHPPLTALLELYEARTFGPPACRRPCPAGLIRSMWRAAEDE